MSIGPWLVVFAQAIAPAAPSSQAASAPGSAVLAQLVADLDAHNLELTAARRDLDARRLAVKPAGAPADPVLSVGYMAGLRRPPFAPAADDIQGFRGVGVSQELPWPGTLAQRTRVAAADATATAGLLDVRRLDLIAELKAAYFEYVAASRSLDIIARYRTTLDALTRAAEARFSVGGGPAADVLKGQLDVSRALEQVAALERERAVAASRINQLVGRAVNTPIPLEDDFLLSPEGVAGPVQHAEGHAAPHVTHVDAVVARADAALSLARKQEHPSFTVDFFVRQYTGGQPWMSGFDVMVNLPIFSARKQQALVQEAGADLEAARAQRDQVALEAEQMAAEQQAVVDESQRLLKLYADTVLPQARIAQEAASASYASGQVDFAALVASSLTVFDVEMAQTEQQKRLRQALARLEPLVGRELVK